MKTFAGSFDHSLETLECRSLLSGGSFTGPGAIQDHQPAVVVADATFLNAKSDATNTSPANSGGDADMYQFGGVWGTQAAGEQVRQPLDLSGGAVDQEPGGPVRNITPSDLSTLVPVNFGQAAPYDGSDPVITANTDPVIMDGPTDDPADAPILSVPATETAPPPPSAPIVPVVVAAPASVPGIEWIDAGGDKPKDAAGATIPDQVVIASTFIAH